MRTRQLDLTSQIFDLYRKSARRGIIVAPVRFDISLDELGELVAERPLRAQLFEQLRIHLLLNLSRCKRKMGDLESAAETAGQVLPFLLNLLLERCPNWYCLLLLYMYRKYVLIRKISLLVKKLH